MQIDINNPVTTAQYGDTTFLYVLGEPVHWDTDKEDIEQMAQNLRARFAALREAERLDSQRRQLNVGLPD